MTRRLLMPLILPVLALSGCRWPGPAASPSAPCSPPAGGRCAADVAWSAPIHLTPGGMRLHGDVGCGGVLHATETSDRVTITLHVGAVPAGAMSCAVVDVGVRLGAPLGSRSVVDGVSGRTVRVVRGPEPSRR